jgi:hypothetical protein
MLSFSNKIEYGGDKLLKYTTARMRVTLFFPLWLSVAALASALAASGVFFRSGCACKNQHRIQLHFAWPVGSWGVLGVLAWPASSTRGVVAGPWPPRAPFPFAPPGRAGPTQPFGQPLSDHLGARPLRPKSGISWRALCGRRPYLCGTCCTLWGLSRTVLEIADVIGTLPTQDISETVFAALKDQLRRPLQGMGMAFSSSLFGVAGSVTLNFILMQVDRAADRFFHASETWALRIFKHADSPLAQTNLGQETPGSERVLQDHLRGLDQLAEALLRTDARHKDLVEATTALGNRLITMTDLMRTQQTTLARWSEEQQSTRHALERMAGRLGESGLASDEAVRTHLAQTAKAVQGLYHHVVVQPKALFPEI